MVTLRAANRREGLPRKGGDYADKVIEVLNEMGYLVEDRAADSGIFADIELSRKFSDETLIVEAKNSAFKFSEYTGGFGHYFAKWLEGDFDRFYLFVKTLEKDGIWNVISNAEENLDELEDLFDRLLDEASDEFNRPVSEVLFDEFRDFLANTDVWQYSYDELDRIHDRIERTGEYDDKPFLTDYDAIPKDGVLYSNLLHVTSIPNPLYRIETIDEFAEAEYRNYNPDYLPVEPHRGELYSLIPPTDLPEGTQYYIKEGSTTEIDFRNWIESDSKDRDDITRALFVRLVALKARNHDCRYNRGNNGALLYARYGEEYGEERTSDGIWIAKPMDRRSEFRHRGVWIEAKTFANDYYLVFKPTLVFTWDGEEPVDSKTKSELTHKFAGRSWPMNHRKRRVVDAWETLLQNPRQASLQQDSNGTDPRVETQFSAVSNQIELTRVDGFVLPSRPPKTPREQRELIQTPEILTKEENEFVEDINRYT